MTNNPTGPTHAEHPHDMARRCYCGCGQMVGPSSTWASGCDARILYGIVLDGRPIVAWLADHGYGPGDERFAPFRPVLPEADTVDVLESRLRAWRPS